MTGSAALVFSAGRQTFRTRQSSLGSVPSGAASLGNGFCTQSWPYAVAVFTPVHGHDRLRRTPAQVAHRRRGEGDALERQDAVGDGALHGAAFDLHLIRKRRVRAKSREPRHHDRHYECSESLSHRVDTSWRA